MSKYGYQIARAAVDATTLGDNTIVAAVPGMCIVVVALYIVSSDTNIVKFQSSTTTDLTGPVELSDQTEIQLQLNEYGWISTSVGEALNLNLTKANQISGVVNYFLE